MTIRSIQLEYQDGTRRTLTPDQLALEFLAFLGRYPAEMGRCQVCNGSGKIGEAYCPCQLGRDLAKVETRSLQLP
jgi:hypothetical protein